MIITIIVVALIAWVAGFFMGGSYIVANNQEYQPLFDEVNKVGTKQPTDTAVRIFVEQDIGQYLALPSDADISAKQRP